MTTNKPTTYWAPSTALHKLESRHNNAPCILTDGPAEFNDVALVRISDYEALQAECEKLRSIISDLKDWDCDVMGGFLSIPVDLRRRMQEAIDAAMTKGAKP